MYPGYPFVQAPIAKLGDHPARARLINAQFATSRAQEALYAAQDEEAQADRVYRTVEAAAWCDYHDAHGWPVGEDDYRRRLLSSAGRVSNG